MPRPPQLTQSSDLDQWRDNWRRSEIDDPGRQRDVFERATPWASQQFVTVTFEHCLTPTAIKHQLQTVQPGRVRYEVVSTSAPYISIFGESTFDRPWQPGVIFLQSTTAPLTVRLLLIAEREAQLRRG